MAENEITTIDIYAQNTGGYSCINNNIFNNQEAWVAMNENTKYYDGRPIALLWIEVSLKIDGKPKKHLKKNGSRFDTCMLYNI